MVVGSEVADGDGCGRRRVGEALRGWTVGRTIGRWQEVSCSVATLAVKCAGTGDQEVVDAAERDPGIVVRGMTRRLQHAVDHHGGRAAILARPKNSTVLTTQVPLGISSVASLPAAPCSQERLEIQIAYNNCE
ncbi:hypothetical protein E2562_007156 [Oryza meyeriana var. granulata]|uniref:Uncharacterized protein n=1 Tax=Oryza meyeriana var. granulata TaxID=110450 RepID=A0A6G1CFB7_9ORYZ|nr:hypothetical protein E2562_007156 [Oryza meyeriana var. granulata]